MKPKSLNDIHLKKWTVNKEDDFHMFMSYGLIKHVRKFNGDEFLYKLVSESNISCENKTLRYIKRFVKKYEATHPSKEKKVLTCSEFK